ncbi:MAG: hypothetical protein AAGA73_06975 [Pseudomonadota bacterium]
MACQTTVALSPPEAFDGSIMLPESKQVMATHGFHKAVVRHHLSAQSDQRDDLKNDALISTISCIHPSLIPKWQHFGMH